MNKSSQNETGNLYQALFEKIFFDRYTQGLTEIRFEREDLPAAAAMLNVPPPKNLGDAIYALRYRVAMPERILATQPNGMDY